MRLGVIGGNGHHYLTRLIDDDGVVDAVAVCGDGRDDEAAKRRFDALSNRADCAWYDSADEMLDAFKPTAVNVGAVYAHNGEMILKAVSRGVPVVSDKPIASSWETLDQLRTAAANGATILTEFDLRCMPAIAAARSAVQDGLIGDVVLANAQKSYRFGTRSAWYGRRSDYGGTIGWVASHAIDFTWFVTGRKFAKVIGMGANVARPDYPEMEDVTAATYELEGGALAVVHTDYNRPQKAATHGDDRIRVVGTRGVVEVCDSSCMLITHNEAEHDITDTAGDIGTGSEELLRALNGERDDIFSTEQSLYMAAVILHTRDALDQGGVVAID